MTTLRTASLLILLSVALNGLARGADEPAQPTARERLKARIAEDAKKVPAKSPAPAVTPPTSTSPAGEASEPGLTAASPTTDKGPDVAVQAQAAGKAKAAAKASDVTAKTAPTLLPKVEVKKSRITVLDHERALQDIEIAREKKNLQVSEVDSALNDSKIARPLAIFGGDSAQFRKGVASERVQLMEAEKDLIEAIAFAKTKEEKAALQKQLNDLKTMRRELDKTMR